MLWASVLLLTAEVNCLYSRKSPVKTLDARDFDKTIRESDQLTIVKFMAPWCGHCKNLVPVYEKVAAAMEGLVNVSAINCDEDANKSICGKYGIQGFPTLKIMRPVKKNGKRTFKAIDYNGQRTVKAIVDQLRSDMPSEVRRLESEQMKQFLSHRNETAKVLLFTKKGTISPIFKALSTTYKDQISFAQVRDNQKAAVAEFGVENFPTLLILPGGMTPAETYTGEMKLAPMSQFLSSFAPSDSTLHAKGDAAQSQETASVSKPDTKIGGTTPTVLKSYTDFLQRFTDQTIKSFLLVSEDLAKSTDLEGTMANFFVFSITPATAKAIEDELSIPATQVVYLNTKKLWYTIPSSTITTRTELLEFLDDIRQGNVAVKEHFVLSKQKEEL